MTTLVLQSQNFLWKNLRSLLEGTKKTLSGIMLGYILARQNQVNYQVAMQMRHEYPNMTVEQIHAELNRKTLESVTKNA
jgi:hypothetical protein